jgi:RHS repeat-associated protein
VGYSYLANSPLAGQIMFSNNGVLRMTTSKQYDYLNRLTSVASASNSFAYQYNTANQRTQAALMDGSTWRYQYDALGQVIAGNKSWVDGTPVAGQQFDYTFDTIGNRTQTQAGGDQNGANLRVANYTNNTLNQITSRGVPGDADVMGLGLATNSVTVNGQTAYRKGEYFRQQLGVTNTLAAVWQNVTVASGSGSVSGHLYVPQTPETNYTYDADGDLLSDGRWNYAWDGENRLLGMTSLTNAPGGSQMQLAFTYDYMGRRLQKMVSTNNGSAYVGEYTNNYVYDGWNCIALLNSSFNLLNSFLWGSDLSGSLQGAGGVGGLIKVTYYGASTTNCFVAFDGNGNVSALVNASDGTIIASYEYGPFGELIRASGPMAKLNPFRFSTKYYDDETDFLYYGYRYYNPSTGRWPNRDPIAEPGFEVLRYYGSYLPSRIAFLLELGNLNLYEFVQNEPVSDYDLLGLNRNINSQRCADMIAAMQAANAAYKANPTPANQQAWQCAVALAQFWCAWPPPPPPPPPSPVTPRPNCDFWWNRDKPNDDQYQTPSTCSGIRG